MKTATPPQATTVPQRKLWKERQKYHEIIRQGFFCEIRREIIARINSPIIVVKWNPKRPNGIQSRCSDHPKLLRTFQSCSQNDCKTESSHMHCRADFWSNFWEVPGVLKQLRSCPKICCVWWFPHKRNFWEVTGQLLKMPPETPNKFLRRSSIRSVLRWLLFFFVWDFLGNGNPKNRNSGFHLKASDLSTG